MFKLNHKVKISETFKLIYRNIQYVIEQIFEDNLRVIKGHFSLLCPKANWIKSI